MDSKVVLLIKFQSIKTKIHRPYSLSPERLTMLKAGWKKAYGNYFNKPCFKYV